MSRVEKRRARVDKGRVTTKINRRISKKHKEEGRRDRTVKRKTKKLLFFFDFFLLLFLPKANPI